MNDKEIEMSLAWWRMDSRNDLPFSYHKLSLVVRGCDSDCLSMTAMKLVQKQDPEVPRSLYKSCIESLEMLESLVTTLLNTFLGAYISNLNYNQMKIGIWNGTPSGSFQPYCTQA
jgi:hypothetical protein